MPTPPAAPTSGGNGKSNGSHVSGALSTLELERRLADAARNEDPENPYLPSVKLHNDIAALTLRENARLWTVVKALAVFCVLLLGLAYYNSMKQPFVGALTIDRTSNTVSVAALPSIQEPQIRQSLVNYFLPLVIESAFTVSDVDSNQRNIVEFVRPYVLVPSQASAVFSQYFQKYDPNRRAQSVRVRIVVDKIPPQSRANEYVVGWTAYTTSIADGTQVGPPTHYSAVIDLQWGATSEGDMQNSDPQKRVGPNISGMRISSFSVLTPNGNPAQSPDGNDNSGDAQ